MITHLAVSPYSLPVRLRGASQRRRGWWLTVTSHDGLVGVGDAAPWPVFGAAPGKVLEELTQLSATLRGAALADVLANQGEHAATSEAAHALETALLAIVAQREGVPLCRLLAPSPEPWVRSHVLVSTPAEATQTFQAFQAAQAALAATRTEVAAADAAILKLKLSRPVNEAIRLTRAVCAAAPGLALRLDANGAFSLPDALELIDALSDLKPAWVEQPVADLADFTALRGRGVALAADESVVGHPLAVVASVADVLVIKPMFVGGVRAAVRLARQARALGRTVCITHALESSVGRHAALHVAAAVGGGVHGVGDASNRGQPMRLSGAQEYRPTHAHANPLRGRP